MHAGDFLPLFGISSAPKGRNWPVLLTFLALVAGASFVHDGSSELFRE